MLWTGNETSLPTTIKQKEEEEEEMSQFGCLTGNVGVKVGVAKNFWVTLSKNSIITYQHIVNEVV